MAIPVEKFDPETFAQANPFMAGLSATQGLMNQYLTNQNQQAANAYQVPNLQQALLNAQYNNQILQPKAQTANQWNAAGLAYANQQAPNLAAQTQGILQGQIPVNQAQAGLYGTEAAKNQFLLNNPGMMAPGMAGQIAGINYLQQHNPGLFQSPGATQQPQVQTPPATGVNAPLSTTGVGLPSAPAIQPGAQNNNPGMSNLLNPPLAPNQMGASAPTQPANNQQLPPPPVPNGMTPNTNINAPMPPNVMAPNGQISSPNSLVSLLMQGVTAPLREQVARANYYQTRASGYAFQELPADQKAALVAQAAGLGISPTDATQAFLNGATIEDLARSKGVDPSNMPSPIYPTTQAQLTQIQRRNQALAEINTLEPTISNAIAPYSRRFAGFSPAQVADSITGDNPDQQAQYLAARAIMPEMSALRVKAMGGQVGVEAINEITDASMGNLGAFGPTVSPKVYKAAQGYVTQWLNQAVQSANNTAWNSGQFNKQVAANANGAEDGNPQSQSTSVAMPKFKTKQEFQSWYLNLPPNQQVTVLQQMGGK
jgi:hypothetical protein